MTNMKKHKVGTEKIYITEEPVSGLKESFSNAPARAKAALLASVVALVGLAVVGAISSSWGFVIVLVVCALGAVSVNMTVKSHQHSQLVAKVVGVLGVLGAVLSFVASSVWWAVPSAVLCLVGSLVVIVVARNFAPAKHALPESVRVKLEGLPTYQVLDLPVPGGAQALVASNGNMFLLGVAGGDTPSESSEYKEFVGRKARLEPVLERMDMEMGAIALCVDHKRFGPQKTDDGITLCSFSTLRKATGGRSGTKNRKTR